MSFIGDGGVYFNDPQSLAEGFSEYFCSFPLRIQAHIFTFGALSKLPVSSYFVNKLIIK